MDAHLKARVPVKAGLHEVGVTFIKNSSSLVETQRDPYQARYNMHRHPRLSPAIYQVSVTGPYASQEAGETASRRKLFVCYPKNPGEETACAERIVSAFVRRAYRRPVVAADWAKPLKFYHEAKEAGGFEAGDWIGPQRGPRQS